MTTKYTLDFLTNQFVGGDAAKCDVTEFRLLCSGIIYRAKVQAADWRKSDITRVILNGACKLHVSSHPMDDYPQELVLLLPILPVSETKARKGSPASQVITTFRPDDIVARDMAALLTLLLRRLVTVFAKVRVISPAASELWRDRALPLQNSLSRRTWKRRPFTFIYRRNEVKVDDPNPPPKAVDADELNALLSGLPYLPTATAFLLSARLYSEAMEIIEERPEIAYLLLVASAEAIASAELAEWEPDDTEKIKAKGDIVAEGRRLGLDNTNAKSLALVAVKDNAWIRRKFLKFLTEHVDEQLLKSRDELYIDTKGLFGPKGSFSEALSAIYSARGAALHGGRRYGPSVGVGTSAWIPVDATTEVLTGQVGVPPVTWFERVVNLALCTYLQRSVQHR